MTKISVKNIVIMLFRGLPQISGRRLQVKVIISIRVNGRGQRVMPISHFSDK
jgi:hypothetical protein